MDALSLWPVAPVETALAPQPTARIVIVDDDEAVQKAVARLLRAGGYEIDAYASAQAFLAGHDADAHGCVLLDVAMPGLDGLALQRELSERGSSLPVIFLTGQSDVRLCAQAMKHGAFDYLTKPVDEHELFEAVLRALEHDLTQRRRRAQSLDTEHRLAQLTPREHQVLMQVVAGRLNKQIAYALGTAEKTVKVHRARGMEKMHVRSVAQLVRLIERARPGQFDDPA